ncbi:DUF397 domain-containing protein [Streptomyces sp. NBC_00557]|uniref:DUF397 domain-containing protein n=1 Tax=Streptomyces sp. NBC_00557 TaxID=2975776 RepID=UPI002E810807|nr:DUF397 domain-containing protein [Streptomyces sp. NBC_00557]WUC34450.1 DUF397 domain-containing protein [Streptomyces sp. NBC_00557]
MAEPWAWRKSSFSDLGTDDCVEVACTGERIMVRDTKHRDHATLRFTPASWRAFLSRPEALGPSARAGGH